MAGKCISAIGLGALIAVGITHGVECIPADNRPVLLSLYGIANALGVFIGACILVGSSMLEPVTNDWQWKVLVLIQIPAGVVLAGLVWRFPESPRWLLIQHHVDEAHRSFAFYFNGVPDSSRIETLVQIVQGHLRHEEVSRHSTSWTDIYRGRNLRRTLLSGFILTMLALCGVQFVLTYGTVFLMQAGISNVYVTNVAISACTLAGSLLSPVSLEYAGCRGSVLWSSAATAFCMLTFAAVSSGSGADSEVARNVLVTFICLWAFCFGAGLGGAAWLTSSEMHSLRPRTYGQASSAAVYQIWSFAATFWTPYMLRLEYGNMGTNVGYFYFGLTLVMFVLAFLFVPETAKLSLEQIDDYFNSGRPAWRTSLRRNRDAGA
ncbi:hypothetical protein M409DRAFT_70950 [Zasmidium cellare ATCC 36951]|uniref:Major facilitator superfamily (MFS) profile domain-containing protein n=1 Tax=Zasmidium cellare ATCC 36951 TaxID=1080233 RepID=A0A6A6BXR6_ZASCE|nr:uncharacterized protein M409DRAFT_70950 [Zasmidium cellare ATCC 36951]KAF2159495.1 hypothetical protein M409DRAFT_70950 [Zasmidium cellare ATCC 36951]